MYNLACMDHCVPLVQIMSTKPLLYCSKGNREVSTLNAALTGMNGGPKGNLKEEEPKSLKSGMHVDLFPGPGPGKETSMRDIHTSTRFRELLK